MRPLLVFAIFLLTSGLAVQAQPLSQPLAALAPSASRSHVPDRDATPQPAAHQTFHGKTGDALRMFSDADVTYPVPAGMATFTGMIAFSDFRSVEPESTAALARLYLRFVVDGQLVMSFAMDHQTPLVRFDVPVAGGHTLTISADGEFAGDFYLLNAGFSPSAEKASTANVLAPGEGYVSVALEARQTMYHAYYSDEAVTVTVASGSPVSSSEVRLRFTPEQTRFAPSEFRATLPMHTNSDGTCEGTTSWKVPAQRGPARVDINAQASGRVIYQEQRRIAVIAKNDLAAIPNSVFGIHSSTAGLLVPQDEFAAIWGAKWARIYLQWSIIERKPGQYDFSYIEPVLDAYRAQHMRILAVLGERAPAWAGQVGPQYYAAWKRWVTETVRHLQPKIDAWDLFNEVDSKYYAYWRDVDPKADLAILQAGIAAVRSASPSASIVCCSTGTYSWLNYDRRIFDAGILKQIDVASLHPYMLFAPEEKDPVLNYPEKVAALEGMIRTYGQSKVVWSTEANWIRGPQGAPDVNAPDINEHTQAQYAVRVNLLTAALNVPYFLHMPMNHHNHRQLQLDELSGYANATALLSTAKGGGRSLVHAPGAWAFAWDTRDGTVGALWTQRGTAEVAISGIAGARFLDMYGNPVGIQPGSVRLSADPIYFIVGSGASPNVIVRSGPEPPHWTVLPPLDTWRRVNRSQYSEVSGGLRVVIDPTTYGHQLVSPLVAVHPEACYLAKIDFRSNQADIALAPQDAATHKNLGDGNQFGLWSLTNGQPQEAVIRFKTGPTRTVEFLVSASHLYGAATADFTLLTPAIAPCPE